MKVPKRAYWLPFSYPFDFQYIPTLFNNKEDCLNSNLTLPFVSHGIVQLLSPPISLSVKQTDEQGLLGKFSELFWKVLAQCLYSVEVLNRVCLNKASAYLKSL